MAEPPARVPSGITLREYYHDKREQGPAASPQSRQQQRGGGSSHAQPPSRPSGVTKWLARLSPRKAGSSSVGGEAQAPPRQQGAALGLKQAARVAASGRSAAQSDSGGGIPAFRPAGPVTHPPAYGLTAAAEEDDDDSSPGKVQLQQVRSLPRQPQPALARQQAPAPSPPADTPGLSEASSMGRVINEHIGRSIADLFMPTPPAARLAAAAGGGAAGLEAAGSGRAQTSAAGTVLRQQQQQLGEQLAAHKPVGGPPPPSRAAPASSSRPPQQHQQQPAPPAAASVGAGPEGSWVASTGRAQAAPSVAGPAAAASGHRGEMPLPPPAPSAPMTAKSESLVLEAQSFKSPTYLSRRTRSMVCELDEPGRNIPFPKPRRRTSRLQRFLATMLGGCFVPPPGQRSPAPSLHTPGGRRTPSSQGLSPPPAPKLFGMDPLRRSLPELSLGDASLRDQLAASLAAGRRHGSSGMVGAGGAADAARHSPFYADLLGLHQQQQEEDAQANMASPVLPSRHGTPPGLAQRGGGSGEGLVEGSEASFSDEEDEEGDGLPAGTLAKRNLMEVLRSREAPPPQQAQHAQQQHQQAWQRQQRGAAAPSPQRAGQAPAGKAKATHVSLAQLLVAGPGGARAAGQRRPRGPTPQQRPRLERTGEGVGGGGKAPSSGSKRGRDALGVSRALSDDVPAFTPKRRDLSKPSYRSHALHQLLSPGLGAAGGAAAGQAGTPGPLAAGLHAGSVLGAQAANATAAAAGRAALRRSVSAPVSPLRAMPAVGQAPAMPAQKPGKGSSAPASPLLGPRMTRAATIRTAATQRKIQAHEAQVQALMLKSPDRWLRAAAAEGLSLREAAVLVSPGKSARPHYHPSPAPGGRPGSRNRAGAAATPAGASRFDSFAAGEAGVEPYSARLHSVERPRPAPEAARAPAAGGAAAAAAPAAREEEAAGPGGVGVRGLDFDAVAADGNAYLQMLQRMAEGLEVEQQQIAPYKRPTQAPIPAHLLAGAAEAGRRERERQEGAEDGAETVRPCPPVAEEALAAGRTTGATIEYCLESGPPEGASTEQEPAEPAGRPAAALHTPHHNLLYFTADATPTKSSPVAHQRMVSMSAAAARVATEQQQQEGRGRRQQAQQQTAAAQRAGAQQRRQQSREGAAGAGRGGRRQASSGKPASTASAQSISFGSVANTPPVEASGESSGPASRGQSSQVVPAARAAAGRPAAGKAVGGSVGGGNRRLERLAALLEERQAQGQRFMMADLHAAGYSSHDLDALKKWLAQQGRY